MLTLDIMKSRFGLLLTIIFFAIVWIFISNTSLNYLSKDQALTVDSVLSADTNHENSILTNTSPKRKVFSYDTLAFPDFLLEFYGNHATEWAKEFDYQLQDELLRLGIDTLSESDKELYFRLHFLHKLFTCNSASTGNAEGILRIPYFWHWVTPNPRKDIMLLENNKLLGDLPTLPGFNKYASRAMIDRTPGLYWSDLLTVEPSYHHFDADTFYTFGWCSEREMAFSALCQVLGLKSKVVVNGNHSWSELLIQFSNDNYYVLMVDNTFDLFYLDTADRERVREWNADYLALASSQFYNREASKLTNHKQIRSLNVLPAVSERMEIMLNDWWDYWQEFETEAE